MKHTIESYRPDLKYSTLIYITCATDSCNKEFTRTVKEVKSHYKKGRKNFYCSPQCLGLNSRKQIKASYCLLESCQNPIAKHQETSAKFCSRSCAATFNNRNKTHGFRRSRAEIYLCSKLEKLKVKHTSNDRFILPSGLELDAYLPDHNIAFEINGATHYKPIYGIDKYRSIIKNDKIKFEDCLRLNIQLFIIDISKLNYDQSIIKIDQVLAETLESNQV